MKFNLKCSMYSVLYFVLWQGFMVNLTFLLLCRLDPTNRDARDGLNRIDLVGSRPGVHDAAGGSYDQMDLALEEEEINDASNHLK